MKILGQRGVSMAEGMIGLGLLGGVAVLGTQLAKMSNSSQGVIDSKINSQSLMAQVKGYLENADACKNTLGGMDAATGGPVPLIKNKLGNTIFEPGKKYDGVTLVSLSLVPPNPSNGSYLNLPAKLGFVDLEAKLLGKSKPDGSPGLEMTKRARIWIMTTAPGASVIDKCSAGATGTDTVWLRSYWDASNIFYGDGRVATGGPVGSNTTSFNVIDGRLRVASIDDQKLILEAAGTNPSYKITTGADRPVAFTNSATGQLADVEMGELTASGKVKVGANPVPCTYSMLGAIRYNSSLNRNQVCARVEVMGSVTPTTTCIRWSSPEPSHRVTYAASPASQRYVLASPFQQGAASGGPYSWVGGAGCPFTVTTSVTYAGASMGSEYQCDSGGNPDAAGTSWCLKCEYTPPSVVRDYEQADPGDPVGEPGEPVIDPLVIDGISYSEVSRTTVTPPATCLEYDETFVGPGASFMFRWVSMP